MKKVYEIVGRTIVHGSWSYPGSSESCGFFSSKRKAEAGIVAIKEDLGSSYPMMWHSHKVVTHEVK